MKTLNLKSVSRYLAIGLITSTVLFNACKKDKTDPPTEDEKSNTKISMTDAPIDNSEVSGMFITVTQVKLDGQVYDGFKGKKTFNIMAMQNGSSEILFDGDLSNRTYNEIEFVLDTKTDAQGNSPGTYIMTKTQTKKAIKSNTSTDEMKLTLKKSTQVVANNANDFVVDFDLRKSVTQETTGEYKFSSDAELSNSLRIVQRNQSAIVKGKIDTANFSNYDKVIAYVYVKGSFDKSKETQAYGADKIYFRNAVSSSAIINNNFGFYFLEKGNYELQFAGYKDTNSDGKLELTTLFTVTSNTTVTIGDFNLNSNSTIDLDLKIVGILGL